MHEMCTCISFPRVQITNPNPLGHQYSRIYLSNPSVLNVAESPAAEQTTFSMEPICKPHRLASACPMQRQVHVCRHMTGATATYGRFWPSHPPPSASSRTSIRYACNPTASTVSYTGVHPDIVDQPISNSSLPDTLQGWSP